LSNHQPPGLLAGDFIKLTNSLVAIVDFSGRFGEVNPACINSLGYSVEEIVGASLFDFSHPDDLDRIIAELGSIDTIATNAQLEYRFLCKNGSCKLLHWDVQRIHEKEVYFLVGRDILAEEQTKRSLEEARNTLNSVVESIPAMIFMKEAEDLRFIHFNRGGEVLLGISREELIGKNDYDLFSKEQADFFTSNDRAVLISNKVLEIPEEPIQNSKGETIYLKTSKVGLRDINGVPTYLLGISIDITERRNAELRLREVNAELSNAQAEAEKANRAKSDFLARMSHEIRTPMNGVLGMADVLRETSLHRNQVEMVELIQTSAFSLLHIIDDILDFSKIEAGQLDIEVHPFNPVDSVESVCAMLKNLALKKNVVLTVFAEPALPSQIQGDSRRLQQVFINLINNAIKFSSKVGHEGRVSVHATTHTQSDEQVVIDFTIRDNGIGMDQATQARLFTPFMQKDSTTSRIFGGTGLGLVITHNLVDLMGGSITVESNLGQGAVFKVRIPFAVDSRLSQEQELPSGVEGLPCLLVGDALGPVSALAAYLIHAGASVKQVSDITAAEAWAEGNRDAGKWLWIIEMEGMLSDKEQYFEEIGLKHSAVGVCPILVVQHGAVYPRADEYNFISIEGNALSRQVFLREVARAANQRKSGPREVLLSSGQSAKHAVKPVARTEAEKENDHRVVLVADDNEINQKVMLRQLQMLGYKGEIANDGREALECWRNGNYALLFTDLHMPNMDGYELCAAIRAEEGPSERLPIILVTANVLADKDAVYLNTDLDGYMTKPARLDEFREILEKWLVQTP
tara:strand:- start:8567 stop:10969 length:2403 start_codon:yes stop_codon:yes gene_type:complete